MALVVQKYGGTSVGDPDRIKAVADHIARTARAGNEVVVTVSAMGKTTDDLLRLAHDVAGDPGGRELDMLLTAGERISIALVAMAVCDLGVSARSFTGSQAGIVTDTEHGNAKIVEIKGDRIREALDAGHVAIVAGFQGVSTDKEIVTLGRGASDLTAVALAARFGAAACEIYTDVEGVYTADPRIVPSARKQPRITLEEMLEMAATGGRVLALRSVEYARNHGVRIHVRSSFTWAPGTWVEEEDPTMEQAIISGVTHDSSEAKVTIGQVPDKPGVAGKVFRALADATVNVDMIVQNVSTEGHTDISFTVPRLELGKMEAVMAAIVGEIGAGGFETDSDVGRVSLVGAGMKTHPGVAATMFETLATNGINIEMISTSTIRISCVVREGDVERAVVALHNAFGLETA
ncbi:MAG TPA: aspartate kinase [Acidimicrobiia bacterium]